MEWREAGGVRWLEARLPGATAAFSTRLGRVGEAPFDSLNLGVFTEDEREAVVENRVRLAAALGFEPARIAIGRQVHGAEEVLATLHQPQPMGRNVNSGFTFRPIGCADLPGVARRLLAEAGVERVESSGLCTSCEAELLFSHRRDAGRTGRQAGLVWRDKGGG